MNNRTPALTLAPNSAARAPRRSLRLIPLTLALAVLTGCASGPGGRQSALDADQLLKQSPPALGRTLGDVAGGPDRGLARRSATREDPTSGLRVDIGPALASSSRTDTGNGPSAIGIPTDPLSPETPLNLSDDQASLDLWSRIRQGYALPPLESSLVGDHERWYAARPDYVQRMTQRGGRYLFHIVEEVKRRGMPAELALLPFIESAFNPQAMSSARASGMWQFMPATGKDFELKQNLFRDDRRDVLASTRAALTYLQRLHRMFGDWHLALAAYNWGEGNVQRAIQRNQRQGLPTDYLSLNMPAETRNYVPKLHAVRNIVMQPERFGLTLPPLENHPYFVSVPLQRDMDVHLAARLAGLPLEEFKALNPSQNKPVILAAGTPQILLPYDNAGLFVRNLEQHRGPLASWTAWQVPRTMRPGEAAKLVGMSEAGLRDVNRIPPKMLVRAGSTLLVPRPEHRAQDVSEALADNATMALAPDVPPMRRVVLRAGKRDTVASVARRYRVAPSMVAQWNRTGLQSSFTKGQQIVVFVPRAPTRSLASGSGRNSGRKVAAVAPRVQSSAKATPRARAAQRNRIRVASAR